MVDKKAIKLLSIIGFAILGLALMFGLVHLGLFNPFVNNAAIERESISYVLVNEDLGATFGGQAFNLGAEFVNLIKGNRRTGTRLTTSMTA